MTGILLGGDYEDDDSEGDQAQDGEDEGGVGGDAGEEVHPGEPDQA